MSREIYSIDPIIVKFIKKHHVLTLATARDNIPWTAHCFYAFLEEENALVFTTDDNTRHGEEMLENQKVSGGIVLETKVVGMIQGVQLTGKVQKLPPSPGNEVSAGEGPGVRRIAQKAYLKRFPYAALMKTTLWVLEIETIKFTDNRLGFGKKLLWERN